MKVNVKKILASRKVVCGLLTWVPALLFGVVASFLCQQYFGLTLLQTNVVTFALGGAVYYGVTSPLLDRYMVWSMTREMGAKRNTGL